MTGWLLQTTGGYTAPIMVTFVFLIVGAFTTIVLLRESWAPRIPVAAAA